MPEKIIFDRMVSKSPMVIPIFARDGNPDRKCTGLTAPIHSHVQLRWTRAIRTWLNKGVQPGFPISRNIVNGLSRNRGCLGQFGIVLMRSFHTELMGTFHDYYPRVHPNSYSYRLGLQ